MVASLSVVDDRRTVEGITLDPWPKQERMNFYIFQQLVRSG
jgi:hypothetical protein